MAKSNQEKQKMTKSDSITHHIYLYPICKSYVYDVRQENGQEINYWYPPLLNLTLVQSMEGGDRAEHLRLFNGQTLALSNTFLCCRKEGRESFQLPKPSVLFAQ